MNILLINPSFFYPPNSVGSSFTTVNHENTSNKCKSIFYISNIDVVAAQSDRSRGIIQINILLSSYKG
jgi:hypothetical protein